MTKEDVEAYSDVASIADGTSTVKLMEPPVDVHTDGKIVMPAITKAVLAAMKEAWGIDAVSSDVTQEIRNSAGFLVQDMNGLPQTRTIKISWETDVDEPGELQKKVSDVKATNKALKDQLAKANLPWMKDVDWTLYIEINYQYFGPKAAKLEKGGSLKQYAGAIPSSVEDMLPEVTNHSAIVIA
eukprot:gnl/TRDRNA2_/TRDRNA2_85472_c0_seq1.p1 gnl/TRDRNA2_/TRDRNA2_85472_c0~~gnl/TRDRNA2_/TRDRNA2_85472_c0_seq1.p1  ORF type:complete len:215 (-),score=62.09 gnl/TRDRNA2_/TRDRNA2_85472_c0_seq1:84-635(-)